MAIFGFVVLSAQEKAAFGPPFLVSGHFTKKKGMVQHHALISSSYR
jgi:hypothetical protein